MLEWIKRRRSAPKPQRQPDAEPAKPPARAMAGKYQLLYKYLENRYADTVVLTFADIEDLLGFTLPDQARLRPEWWTAPETTPGGQSYSDSWKLARRTAMPNLAARVVVFERGI